jgi:hypothetical protein
LENAESPASNPIEAIESRKEELLEKMYCLLAELYEKRKKSFAGYFAKKRFLQIHLR